MVARGSLAFWEFEKEKQFLVFDVEKPSPLGPGLNHPKNH